LLITMKPEQKGLLLFITLYLSTFLLGYGYVLSQYTYTVAFSESLGSFLVDGHGRTIYYNTNDLPYNTLPSCDGDCLGEFPFVPTGTVHVPPTLNNSDFGLVLRAEDEWQVTYKGIPLYYFTNDTKPGDTYGEGHMGMWHVVPP